ncbi:FUSC family protein [Nonomuraea sp. NPDC004580]|uniref:FUSC family protein n=1 Tax=Nonomuraea sp. NPDC004580 TaxID=3154552 RepID=UPI0033B70057
MGSTNNSRIRLTAATRAVLGTAATLTVLAALGQPDTSLLAGGFTVMTSALAVDRLGTLALGAPLYLAALAAGAAVGPYPVAAALVFLPLIYAAVRARLHGAIGHGAGVFAFMGFFLAQFTEARAADVPHLSVAVVVAFCAVLCTAVRVPNPAEPPRAARRQALQVTAASALAIAGGHLVSPDHWYWAVVTTWVVFINTESTGEVLRQSVRRLVGTVLGAGAGYGLATLAAPYGPLLLVLLLACMFGMFFTSPDAYWAVTFFITGMLCMLLALLDTFSADVLVLRVHETALGACCGVLAARLQSRDGYRDHDRPPHDG